MRKSGIQKSRMVRTYDPSTIRGPEMSRTSRVPVLAGDIVSVPAVQRSSGVYVQPRSVRAKERGRMHDAKIYSDSGGLSLVD